MILYQRQDGLVRVKWYTSRTLTPAEKGYHLHSGKLEFLALKWSITEAFKCYLYQAPNFRVLTYVMSTAKVNATGMWWVGELAEYQFGIKYQPGRVSADVNSLSRISMDIDEYAASCSEHISKEAFLASVNAVLSNVTYDYITTIADIVSIAADMNSKTCASSSNAWRKKVNLVDKQNKDPKISRILQFKSCETRPSSKQWGGEGPSMHQLLYEFDRLFVPDDGILCRKIGDHIQIVLPASLRQLLYQELNEDLGHLGHERVYSLARDRCYWPFIGRDV